MNPLQMLGNGHPLLQMMQGMRTGANPIAMLGQLSGNNPIMARGMQLVQGKTPEQLQQIAQNMAKERGVDLASMLQQFGLR